MLKLHVGVCENQGSILGSYIFLEMRIVVPLFFLGGGGGGILGASRFPSIPFSEPPPCPLLRAPNFLAHKKVRFKNRVHTKLVYKSST